MRIWLASVVLLCPLVAAACSADGSGDGFGRGTNDKDGGDGNLGVGSEDPGSEGPLPPELELEENFERPVVSGPYLFSANPDSNRVALIHTGTQSVDVFDAGHRPKYLASLPPGPTAGGALVINELSDDVSVFVLRPAAAEGEDVEEPLAWSRRVPVQASANAWAVGPAGRFAIAWSRAGSGDTDQFDGYQDLTILEFDEERNVATTELAVGFGPSRVVISDDSTRAYAISDPGISVIDLTADPPAIARELFLPEQTVEGGRDVSLTAGGRHAFVRLAGESSILVVDTETDERFSIELPAPVTDLDLSADGSLAVAVMRGEPGASLGVGGAGPLGPSRVALLDVARILQDEMDFEVLALPELVGSVVLSSDASAALLYTNATPSQMLTVLDTAGGDMRTIDVKAPLLSAFLDDEGLYGAAVMTPPSGSAQAGAFAIFDVAEQRAPRIEGTRSPPQFVSLSGEQQRVLVTTSDSAGPAHAYLGRYPSLRLDDIELPSEPLASGLVPDTSRGFVAQAHPEGRVTLIGLDDGTASTVTGFELASEVVQ